MKSLQCDKKYGEQEELCYTVEFWVFAAGGGGLCILIKISMEINAVRKVGMMMERKLI